MYTLLCIFTSLFIYLKFSLNIKENMFSKTTSLILKSIFIDKFHINDIFLIMME